MAGKSFKGNLEILNLSDIFQSLAMNRHSGTLVVNDGKREKKIFFAEGEICLLSSGRRQKLGDLLITNGKITEEDLDLALKLQKQSRKKLGEILVEEGFCEEEDIGRILRMQVEEELYDLFLWRKAEFEFLADQMPEDMARESPNLTRLHINTNSLIMEALRRLDEWSLIQDAVPTTKEVFVLMDIGAVKQSDVPEVIKASPQSIDGKTTVMGLAEAFMISEFECCQHLAALVKADGIRALTQDELVERAEAAYALNDFNAAAALYGRLAEYHPDEGKILIPLADSLRRTGVEKQALGMYEVLATQLEGGGKDPERLRQCYEAILQLDPSRVDLAQRIEDLDLKLANSPAAKGLTKVFALIVILALVGAGIAFKDQLQAMLASSGGPDSSEDIKKLLSDLKRAEEEAVQLVRKGKLDAAEVKLKEWHRIGRKIWTDHRSSKEAAKVDLPILISTVPPDFDIHVNDIYQGHTTLDSPHVIGRYAARADAVRIELHVKKGKDSGNDPVLPPSTFDADTYTNHQLFAIYAKPTNSIIGVGTFETGVAYVKALDAYLVPSRNGKLRVLELKDGRMNEKEDWDRKVTLGEYGDPLNTPAIIGDRLLVGISEFRNGQGVLSLRLPKGEAPGEPKIGYPGDAQVSGTPVVIEPGDAYPKGRVMFGTLRGGVYAYTAKGEKVWRHDGGAPIEQPGLFLSDTAPGAPKGVVVFAAGSRLRAYSPLNGGRQVWSFSLPSPLAGPLTAFRGEVLACLKGGKILALDGSRVSRLGTPGVRELYTDSKESELTLMPLNDEILAVANRNGIIRALDKGKTILWERNFQRPSRYLPHLALQGPDLLVALDGPEVFALDAKVGQIVWQARFPQGGRTISPISVFGEQIFVGTDKQFLYLFQRKRGEE